MKKKILSFFMGICMCVCSLFTLAGCSLVNEDSTKINKKEVLKVGDVTLTKTDIINSFYTYYQNNSSYFSYYDEETIVESFYTWAIIKEIVNQKAADALFDAEKNPNGFLVYTQEDADEVMDAAFEYIYTQVSAYEKAIYEQNTGIDAEDYPSWLKDAEKEEEKTGFKSYESTIPEIEIKDKADSVKKLTETEVKEFGDELKEYLFEYVSKKAEDEDEEDERSAIDETASKNYIVGARNSAYAKYIEGLVSNAKSSNSDASEEELLLDELVRVYEAYYKSQLTNLLQTYYLENQLLDPVNGDKESLSDKAVVKAYLEAYYTDMQLYQVEDAYIAALTDDEGASLILYNYDGRNCFFTVQHILVAYDEYMKDKVSKIDGYSASGSDYDEIIHENFINERNELTDDYTMLTKINKDSVEKFKDSITTVGGYYYYDEELKGDDENNFGYILLNTEVVDGVTYYTRSDNDEKVNEEDVQYLASETDVLNCYQATLSNWNSWAMTYIAADEKGREDLVKAHESMEYVFETALNIHTFGVKDGLSDDEINAKINNKLASLLFIELQWIYSTDSLGNEYTNKLGYVISNYADENGSWVVDFAVGARDILSKIVDGDTSKLGQANVVTSNFGYHIIKIESVFESGKSLVDMSKLTKKIDINDAEFVEEMADLLRQTYVNTGSNQTLFQYYYDELYTGFVGSSESSGSYFMQMQYKWLAEYDEDDKIKYFEKLDYDELMDAIA